MPNCGTGEGHGRIQSIPVIVGVGYGGAKAKIVSNMDFNSRKISMPNCRADSGTASSS